MRRTAGVTGAVIAAVTAAALMTAGCAAKPPMPDRLCVLEDDRVDWVSQAHEAQPYTDDYVIENGGGQNAFDGAGAEVLRRMGCDTEDSYFLSTVSSAFTASDEALERGALAAEVSTADQPTVDPVTPEDRALIGYVAAAEDWVLFKGAAEELAAATGADLARKIEVLKTDLEAGEFSRAGSDWSNAHTKEQAWADYKLKSAQCEVWIRGTFKPAEEEIIDRAETITADEIASAKANVAAVTPPGCGKGKYGISIWSMADSIVDVRQNPYTPEPATGDGAGGVPDVDAPDVNPFYCSWSFRGGFNCGVHG